MTELKPCPFCGGEAKAYDCEYEQEAFDTVSLGCVDTVYRTAWHCLCESCGALIADRKTESDAIEAWNARAASTRKCPQCGCSYEPKTPEQKYCSRKCSKKAYIERRLGEEGEVPPKLATWCGLEVPDHVRA